MNLLMAFNKVNTDTIPQDGKMNSFEILSQILPPISVKYKTKRFGGKDDFKGRICTVSGAGNVAIHTIEKLYDLGAIPVTSTDSKGTIYDPRGIDLKLLKQIQNYSTLLLFGHAYIQVY